MKLILATLVAMLLSAGPASATDFTENGWWWQQSSPNWSTDAERWTYPDFPRRCASDDPSVTSFEVIWVTRQNGDTPLPQTSPTAARNMFDRASSIFGASNQSTGGTNALNHLTPRFVTGSNCGVKFNYETAPDAVLRRGAHWDAPEAPGIWKYLQAEHGYNPVADNRKYVVVVQWAQAGSDTGDSYGGIAEMLGYGQSDPSSANGFNAGSWIAVNLVYGMSNASLNEEYAETIAHEIGHSIGAVNAGMPNENPQNGGHAADCGDVTCYGDSLSDLQPGEQAVCTHLRSYFRLDCGDDDYWDPSVSQSSAVRWWAHFSSYLWGNSPDPARAGKRQRVVVSH